MSRGPNARHPHAPFIRRRTLLAAAAAAGAGGCWLLNGCSREEPEAAGGDLTAYTDADINWKRAEGTTINVGLIAASYFSDLQALLPQFTELTGITVEAEEIPPQKIRENVVRDLSTGTGRYHTHATDPMYYPLYATNKWVQPIEKFTEDPELCNPEWLKLDDIFTIWRDSTTFNDQLYGIPFDGEVTLQVYRKDLYDEAGLKPAQTFAEFESNAEALHDPDNRLWGTALRGLPGAGQNMYIFPSLFRAWGASWFDGNDNPTVNSDEAVEALTYYVELLKAYAPTAVTNWNWPDIADAFARGTIGSYIDANTSASVLLDPKKSTVIDKLGFDRWPAGPSGNRVSSIWNWSFPVNASLSEKDQAATWLFIQWATSAETQIRTSYGSPRDSKRLGVNRPAIVDAPEYAESVAPDGGYIEASLASLEQDTDIDWRPRVPQWSAIGDNTATLVQGALTDQHTPQQALDRAQAEVEKIMEGAG